MDDALFRWNNGAFFAMLYSIVHFGKFWNKSAHSWPRKLLVSLLFVYYVISMVLGWFLMVSCPLSFSLLDSSTIAGHVLSLLFLSGAGHVRLLQ